MKKRRVWRYKCDFCKKANCSAHAIRKHEIGCTNNPDRDCGICKVIAKQEMADKAPMPLSEAKNLLPLLSTDDEAIDFLFDDSHRGKSLDDFLEQLLAAVNRCPACTLAAIRQSPPNSIARYIHFDYKAATKSFWDGIANDAAA